jgi:hypothetical protein
VIVGDLPAIVGDSGDGGEFEDRERWPLQQMGGVPICVKRAKDKVQGGPAGVVVYGSVEDDGDMATDPVLDLLDTSIKLTLPQEVVDVGDSGGDRGGWLDSWGEASSDRVGSDAFDKACRFLPRLGCLSKRSRGGSQVRLGDDFEQSVPWCSRELLGDTLKACNGGLDVFGGGSRGCLFWKPWAWC